MNIFKSVMKGANFRYLIADDSFYSNMIVLNNDKIQLPLLDALKIYLLMINIKSRSRSQVGSKSSYPLFCLQCRNSYSIWGNTKPELVFHLFINTSLSFFTFVQPLIVGQLNFKIK